MVKASGALALVGGGEWSPPCRAFDEQLLERSGSKEVVVLPTAAAFEHPERVVERARAYFADLGVSVRALEVLNRRDANEEANIAAARKAKFLYVSDGSPLHLRSVLKGSALYDAMVEAHHSGAALAASGAGATVLCDPMVDPRGGAYTVGLGLVQSLAIFPYHGNAAEHIRERSVDLLSDNAVLVGVDEQTALVREGDGDWEVVGAGGVVIYRNGAQPKPVAAGGHVPLDEVTTTR